MLVSDSDLIRRYRILSTHWGLPSNEPLFRIVEIQPQRNDHRRRRQLLSLLDDAESARRPVAGGAS